MFHRKNIAWLAALTGMLAIILCACGSRQESSAQQTLPVVDPGFVVSVPDTTGAPAPSDDPTAPVQSAASSETEAATPTVTTYPYEPYPTDTQYVGPAFNYTRAPGHYLKYLEDFGFSRYRSPRDGDGDGTDDQTDIFLGAKEYLARKPKYNASSYFIAYYNFEKDGPLEGVCTDVIAAALVSAGYDLKALVDSDIENHRDWFTTELAAAGLGAEDAFDLHDPNINYRRVRNLYAFLEHRAEKLTLDLTDLSAWQPGDIVIFFGSSGIWNAHIAIISDRRADDGIPYVLHHANEGQTLYEEDYLISTNKKLVGHYRWSGFNGE